MNNLNLTYYDTRNKQAAFCQAASYMDNRHRDGINGFLPSIICISFAVSLLDIIFFPMGRWRKMDTKFSLDMGNFVFMPTFVCIYPNDCLSGK